MGAPGVALGMPSDAAGSGAGEPVGKGAAISIVAKLSVPGPKEQKPSHPLGFFNVSSPHSN